MDILLLPYTLLVWGLKYIVAIGLWYLFFNWLVQAVDTFDWEERRRLGKRRDSGGIVRG